MDNNQYEPIYQQCCTQLELQIKHIGKSYRIFSASGKPIANLTIPTLNCIDGFMASLLLYDPYFKEETKLLEKDLLDKLGLFINISYTV